MNKIQHQIEERKKWCKTHKFSEIYWEDLHKKALKYFEKNGYISYYDTVDSIGTIVLCSYSSPPIKYIEYFAIGGYSIS